MIKRLYLSVSAVLILCVILGVFYSRTQTVADKVSVSSTTHRSAPPFELSTSDGKKVQFSSFRGKVVVLHFWASWCPPCLDEIGRWVELAASMKGKPIQWIAVSLDTNWSDALKILPSEKLSENITSLLDTETQVSDQYGSFQFPETYLISSDQKIITKWIGSQNWESSEIRDAIEHLLKNSK